MICENVNVGISGGRAGCELVSPNAKLKHMSFFPLEGEACAPFCPNPRVLVCIIELYDRCIVT